jgi:hypothetical protein
MLSTAGQDFIFGFINNYYDDKLLCVLVSNANDRPTSVTVTSIYSTFETIDLIVEPYGVVKVIMIKQSNHFYDTVRQVIIGWY